MTGKLMPGLKNVFNVNAEFTSYEGSLPPAPLPTPAAHVIKFEDMMSFMFILNVRLSMKQITDL